MTGDAADVMQRVVAKAVELMESPFVHGVVPIDLKELLGDGGYTVHIVGIESDDAGTEDVGDVTEGGVFGTLEREFAGEGLFGLDTRLDGCNHESVALQRFAELVEHLQTHALQLRQRFAVLLQNHLAMEIKGIHH